MKRVIVFFILFVSLIIFSVYKTENISFADCKKVVVVSNYEYKELDEQPIKNGNDFYHILQGEKIDFFTNNISNFKYKGLSLYFNDNHNLNYFKNIFNTQFSSPSKVEDYKVYYGYCNGHKGYRMVDGKKINIQLVRTQNEWIAGFPLILTGF